MKKLILAFVFGLLVASAAFLWWAKKPASLYQSGDNNRAESLPKADYVRTIQTRELGRFDFEGDHSVRFILLEDEQPSIAVLEAGGATDRSLVELGDSGHDPIAVWHALNAEGYELPAEMRALYEPREFSKAEGWLAERWRSAPISSANGGPCDNDWFADRVGTEDSFPDANEHFLRFDLWGDGSGFYGGYNQYAGWVDVWHGGFCLEQEVATNDLVAPGTGWLLQYYRYGEFSLNIVTPAVIARPGQWFHWIWYRCRSCTPYYWRQIALVNPGNVIEFDMGMDWSFCKNNPIIPLFPVCQ